MSSRYANQLVCQYCGCPNAAARWPANGDLVPFYCQKQPGRFSISVECSGCGKTWHVAWDDDPGLGYDPKPADHRERTNPGGVKPLPDCAVRAALRRSNLNQIFKREELLALTEKLGIDREDVLPALLFLLEDQDDIARSLAARLIGKLGDPRGVAALIACLHNDDHYSVTKEAAIALDQLAPAPEVVTEFLHALERTLHWNTREYIIKRLGVLGDPRAVEPLLSRINGESGESETTAMEALARFRDPQALKRVLTLFIRARSLSPKDVECRKAMLSALKIFQDGRVVAHLCVCLKDSTIAASVAGAIESILNSDPARVDTACLKVLAGTEKVKAYTFPTNYTEASESWYDCSSLQSKAANELARRASAASQTPLRFSCPHCGAPIRCAMTKAGKSALCPKCGGQITVPNAPLVG